MAIGVLGNGLLDSEHHEDALSVYESQLSMQRRLGANEKSILGTQSNLAVTYQVLGRNEEALRIQRDLYSGHVKLDGVEHENTLIAANNYADSLNSLKRFEEAKSLSRKTLPMARRVLGETHILTLRLRWNYAAALINASGATIDDLREAVTTLEDTECIARRVLGGAHPLTMGLEIKLQHSQAALRAREAPSASA